MKRLTYVLRQRAPPRVAIAVQQVHEHNSNTCTTEVLMRKLLPLGLASLFLVVTGCQDTNTTGPLGGPSFAHAAASHDFEFAMLEDLATETTGASGSGQADVEGGSVEIEVKAEGLIPGHDYELNVTIGPQPGGFSSFVTFGPVTADDDGEVEFEGDIDLAPGAHRLDFFVTHTQSTVAGSGPVGEFITAFIDRDPLLRCFPAVFVTIVADDDDDDDDD